MPCISDIYLPMIFLFPILIFPALIYLYLFESSNKQKTFEVMLGIIDKLII